MKQILLTRSRAFKTGGTAMAGILLAFNAIAQSVPVDTLQTGYGKRSSDQLTEHVQVLHAPQLNQGIIYSTEALLSGQIAGLRVLPGGGAPGTGSEMVLRHGSSIFGNKSPLVVLDGVPLETNSTSDNSSILNFLSPHDIESVALLKDAASIAIYGGRAANGVLYITTKKGDNNAKFRVDFASRAGVSMLGRKANVLSAGDFRDLINRELPDERHLLGKHDTDWQDVIYRKAFSHEQQIGLSGSVLNTVPYRVSFGHLNQNGILKTSQARRNSLALSLNPTFLQDHLRLDLHVRNVDEKMRVADKFAIQTAHRFDPTQPVYDENGDYRWYKNADGTSYIYWVQNPLAMLEQRHDQENTNTLYGHAQLQYNLHFFPSLSVNARYARMDQTNDYSSERPYYTHRNEENERVFETNDRTLNWEQKEAFLAYDQSFERINSRIRMLSGAARREKYFEHNIHPSVNERGETLSRFSYSNYTTQLETLYGQFSLLIKDRYLIETSLAKENSSYLPGILAASLNSSVGASWDIAKESFLASNNFLSGLRLYTNYSRFLKQEGAEGLLLSLNNPEQTQKWNIGLAWGLLDNRLTGDLNYFKNKTSNMYLKMAIAHGGGYQYYITNGGGFVSSGLEASFNYQLFNRPDFRWDVGANLASLQSEVSEFELGYTAYVYHDQNFVLLPGKPINSFHFYEQLYDLNGKPIEGLYKKGQNGNNEKQTQHTSDPKLLFGIRSEASYKNFSADFLLRGSTGNYVFNYDEANRNSLYMAYGFNYLENISGYYPETEFKMPQRYSSHFLENAAFIRLEYLNFSYDVGKIWQDKATLRLNATVQNAFVLTKYKGLDPEVKGSIDRAQYPQPRTFSLGLNLSI